MTWIKCKSKYRTTLPTLPCIRAIPRDKAAKWPSNTAFRVPYRVLLGAVGTVNGSVRVGKGVEGGGDLRSVNGNVEIVESSGRFSAKTTNGDLRLELRHLRNGESDETSKR